MLTAAAPPTHMKAIAFMAYGPPDVLQVLEKETPSPKNNEVLVRVHASSVNAMEWRPFTLPTIFLRLIAGLRRPRDPSLGVDVAGRVDTVGAAVTQFQPGDEVFGLCHGAFAEYACAREDRLVRKPANVSFEAAAAVPLAAVTALQGLLKKGNVQPGQRVLIHGASGGAGTFAVQIAKAFGAEVTAVCSTKNVEMVHSIGADRVIDYTKEDFATSGRRYDVIVVANGNRSILDYWRSLTPDGTCVVFGGAIPRFLQTLLLKPVLSRLAGRKIRLMLTQPTQKDLNLLKELLESGTLVPVIDRTYPLGQVAEAVKYLMEEHGRGKVVVTV